MERIELAGFGTEVGQRFQFLVDLHGMEGPECSDHLLPSVFYRRPGLLVSTFLNQGDGAGRRITISVSVEMGQGSVRAELPALVEAVGFAPGHLAGWKAHNVAAMQRSLDNNAIWLRRLMPELLGPDGLDLARKAVERPKRRQPNVKWKYA